MAAVIFYKVKLVREGLPPTAGGQAGGWLHNCRPVSAFGVRVPGFAVCPNCPHLGQTRKDGEWTLGARASCRVQVVAFFSGGFFPFAWHGELGRASRAPARDVGYDYCT